MLERKPHHQQLIAAPRGKDQRKIRRREPAGEWAALLRLVTDTGDETFAAPKLNRGTFEKPVGLFDSFAVVSANEAPVSNKTILRYEIGPIFWHGAAPLY